MKLLIIILTILTGILNGEYNAKTLSVAEQDSILNELTNKRVNELTSTRYRLESENAEKIFRRSELADWFVVDTMRKTRKRLGEGIFKGQDVKVRDAVRTDVI